MKEGRRISAQDACGGVMEQLSTALRRSSSSSVGVAFLPSMGGADVGSTRRHGKQLALCCLATALFSLASAFFLLSGPSSFAVTDTRPLAAATERSGASCNYSSGRWIRDSSPAILRYDHTCNEIYKGWNCIARRKPNARDLLQWRWQPDGCDLPPLDPALFLRRFRNTNIGFVGDSLNRNMFVSLVCMLKRSSSDGVRKWKPAGADRGYTFLGYNLTVAYHRTNLLVRYGRWLPSSHGGVLESLGYKQGYRVDVDVPEHTWAEAPMFHDILIFNTGHWWWAPSKFDPVMSPMLFFTNSLPVSPPVAPEIGINMALSHMLLYVEKKSKPGSIKFFRTQSPRHFEGGDWNSGGSCKRNKPISPSEVEVLYTLDINRTNAEARLANRHLRDALQGSGFRILEVTAMSEFRADAHPSFTGGKKHEDCMHWCLPGLTDTWNDLLSLHLDGASYGYY